MRIESWRIYQAVSLIAAAILAAGPGTESLAAWQPQWTVLVIVYWVISKPGTAGFGMAWAAGLLSDFIAGSWLGVHVVSYCLIVFLCTKFHRILRLSSTVQKTLPVGILLILHLGCLHLLSILLSDVDPGLIYWASLPTSLLAWPVLHYVLGKIPVGETGRI